MNFEQDIPKYQPIHAKNPRAIITEACNTMGLNVEYFVESLESELNCKIDLDNPLVSEWIYMCELLALEFDSISYGYLDYFHKNRIARYEEENLRYLENFPKTYKSISSHIIHNFSKSHQFNQNLHS